jgi:hypothetical protein
VDPDPSLWQRFTAVVAGVATFAVVASLYMILIDSRVPSPFQWIPGLVFFGSAGILFGMVRSLVLSWFGANDENLDMAAPLNWLSLGTIAVASIVAFTVLYVFFRTATPLHSLQGDHAAVPVIESFASAESARTPMGNDINDETVNQTLDLIASGEMYDSPEDRKVAAVAGNWEQAFGSSATTNDIEYVKDVALLLEADAMAGESCDYFDAVFEFIAQDSNQDRGRVEYVFGAGVMAWAKPDAALRVFECNL